MTAEIINRLRTVVNFPIQFDLPNGNSLDLTQAAEAVKHEYRASVKWKKLRCLDVIPTGDGSVFKLELGQTVEFDWTWEGAVAFRPVDPEAIPSFFDETDENSSVIWFGEVVEVDEANGSIFVWVAAPERPPRKGWFHVRPFEFLANLHSIFCDSAFEKVRRYLPGRLHAGRGGVHPPVLPSASSALPSLKGMWSHSWSVLWGPPGTGKTHTIGQQVATCIADSTERLLIVSTTNKSTDESAFAIGKAANSEIPGVTDTGRILRIGKGAHLEEFQKRELEGLLTGTETDLLHRIGLLTKRLHGAQAAEERAIIRKEVLQLRRAMKDASFNAVASGDVRVVVATSFKAAAILTDPDIRDRIADGGCPFTTVIIDEAGLISRAAIAALSLLASRRVVLVGDSKQLAPISRISRILPTSQATWLAASGLSHLQSLRQTHEAVCLLREQHRMHPHVSAAVSQYQYDGVLEDAETVRHRHYSCPAVLAEQPRAIWYVLDEDGDDYPAIRAERGPGRRSWVRPKTRSTLKKLFADESLRNARGIFVTPFVAQGRDVRAFFAEEGIESWSSATVHSQQGTEADIVIFDTVNAGSTAWPFEEWKRLVNVGLSRAKEFVIVLASRAEMREPYLKGLTLDLSPQVLLKSGNSYAWLKVQAEVEFQVPEEVAGNIDSLGHQIVTRQSLRPVMSVEQQRLCGYNMDGKPRLVRGVAGSGKTAVLAHWLVKTLRRMQDTPDLKIWAVFANRSLSRLIMDSINEAWQGEGGAGSLPINRIELWHIKDLLDHLRVRIPDLDYDAAASIHLAKNGADAFSPKCHAMFIDEAQDLGPSALQLLTSLVYQTDPSNPNSRSVNIFYDNAQNVYGRRPPKWSEVGLDMRGRSFVMQESFRSTKPITEFALNALYRLRPEELNGDHKELVDRGLIEEVDRGRNEWWNVRFNQVHGPAPIVRQFTNRDLEVVAIANQLVSWITEEGVRPIDICVLYNTEVVKSRLESIVDGTLRTIGARLEVQVGGAFTRDQNTIVASTAQSFKGYEAEVVVVAGADKFVAPEKGILANNLYVAMTRARSLLAVYGVKDNSKHGSKIMSVLCECRSLLTEVPEIQTDATPADVEDELLQQIGSKHRSWLKSIMKCHAVDQDPICENNGEILAEPLFWFSVGAVKFACFADEPKQADRHRLEDAGIKLILPGDNPG